MKLDAAFNSLGPIAVPTLNLSLNASLRESEAWRKERKLLDSMKFKHMNNKNIILIFLLISVFYIKFLFFKY